MRKRDLYIDTDEVACDGEIVRVPLLLCDTVRFENSRPTRQVVGFGRR
jgi:hypothetical protein